MRYVFLDTNVYVASNFNLGSVSFKKFIAFVNDGKISPCITHIVYKEIIANIKERVVNGLTAYDRFQKNHNIIAAVEEYLPLFQIILDYDKITKNIIGQVDAFIEKYGYVTIEVPSSSIYEVFDRYFTKRPPFSKEKKKEFPDAFNLLALREFALSNRQKMHVISSDPDFKRFCEREEVFAFFDTLEDFLDKLNSEEEANLRLYEYVKNIIKKNEQEIIDSIVVAFENSVFYIIDHDGEVITTEVDDIVIKKVNIIEYDFKNADIEIRAVVNYEADISFNDERRYEYISSLYDSDISCQFQKEIAVDLNIIYNYEINDILKINKIKINNDESIGINIAPYINVQYTY